MLPTKVLEPVDLLMKLAEQESVSPPKGGVNRFEVLILDGEDISSGLNP